MTAPTLMAILAHPDDETFPVGGTLAKAAGEGRCRGQACSPDHCHSRRAGHFWQE